MYWLRGCYYKLIKKLSDVEQIEQFTGLACMTSGLLKFCGIWMIRHHSFGES